MRTNDDRGTPDPNSKTAKLVNELIDQLGSQAALCRISGLSATRISRWSHGISTRQIDDALELFKLKLKLSPKSKGALQVID